MNEVDNRGRTDPVTKVDPETGALIMKKGEAWLNTFTLAVSYLLRCNHDVTSLMSRTAIKSVIAYVADYITKTPLKTHVMFQSIQNVFDRNPEMVGNIKGDKGKARSIITKMEIGGPMAAMYLLKHPDHYTGHQFRTGFWRGYVYKVMRAWEDSKNIVEDGKTTVVLGLDHEQAVQGKTCIVPISPVLDYMYRPMEDENVCIYDWVRNDNDFENNYIIDELPLHAHTEDDSGYESTSKSTSRHLSLQGGGRPSLAQEEEEDSEDELLLSSCSKPKQMQPPPTVEEEESDDELLLTTTTGKIAQQEHHPAPTAKSKAPSYFIFHAEHPQCRSHEVCLQNEEDSFVPNFVGGPLPWKDQGSREEYCMTMLTLFKPWRSGSDLRSSAEILWDEAFRSSSVHRKAGGNHEIFSHQI
ncbi:hypothetical protein C8Q80DRAFT_1218952 [Daedaleopsis nitida]|nr:hypothetical protein C8Q80DRAFT_1218952 [Daedaleopsis nitida]